MSLPIGIKELLEAGVHFGHKTSRWNPKMKRFIFEARHGIYIIDLAKTVSQLDAACEFLASISRKGGKILFVGTKKQAQEAVKDSAKACNQMHVTERWLGGTLTNLKTIKRSLGRMKQIEKMETDGSMNDYVKQEQSMYRRELGRLTKNLDGLRVLTEMPAAMFIVDIKREHNAVAEARRLKIPLIAIVDTNCDPDQVDYPIPGNDDALRSVRLVLSVVTAAINQGRAEYEAKYARRVAEEAAKKEAPPAEAPAAEAPVAATPEALASLATPVAVSA